MAKSLYMSADTTVLKNYVAPTIKINSKNIIIYSDAIFTLWLVFRQFIILSLYLPSSFLNQVSRVTRNWCQKLMQWWQRMLVTEIATSIFRLRHRCRHFFCTSSEQWLKIFNVKRALSVWTHYLSVVSRQNILWTIYKSDKGSAL